MALLFAAGVVVIRHREFAAVQSRGVPSVLAQSVGGVVWLFATIVTLRGERFGYDSGVNALRAPTLVW